MKVATRIMRARVKARRCGEYAMALNPYGRAGWRGPAVSSISGRAAHPSSISWTRRVKYLPDFYTEERARRSGLKTVSAMYALGCHNLLL